MTAIAAGNSRRITSLTAVFFLLAFQVICAFPASANTGQGDTDHGEQLKEIEYKYYFRGDYGRAIAELRAYLQRDGLSTAQRIEATEFLAASLILTGSTGEGKALYLNLIKNNRDYDGPDPSVFKPIVVSTYEEVRDEYASMVIRTVPDERGTPDQSSGAAQPQTTRKPFYKKWWFYASAAAVVLVLAGAAGAGQEEEPSPDTGQVTVGIEVR